MPSKENYSNDVTKREATMQKFSSFITEWKRGENRRTDLKKYSFNRRHRKAQAQDTTLNGAGPKSRHYNTDQLKRLHGRDTKSLNKEAYQPHQMSLSRMRTLDRRIGSYSKDRDPESNKAKKHVVTDYRRGDKLTTLKKKTIKLPYDSNRARVGRSAIRTSNKKFNAHTKSIPMWNRMGARPSVKEAYQAHQMSTSRFKKFVDKHNPGVPDSDKKIFHDTIKRQVINKKARDLVGAKTHKSNGQQDRRVSKRVGRLSAKSYNLLSRIKKNRVGPINNSYVAESAPASVRDIYSLNAKKAGRSIRVSRSKMDKSRDAYHSYINKPGNEMSLGKTNRKLRNLNNVQNKYDPGRRTMTKTTLNRQLKPYPKPAERSLMNTTAKKAERANRKIGLRKESSTDIGSVSKVRKMLGTDGPTSKAIKTISNKQMRNARANSLLAKHGNDLPSDSRRSNRFKRLRQED